MINNYNNRIGTLKESLEVERLDGYLVANEINILYFTGFLGGSRLLITKEDENVLFVHGVNFESARESVRNCRVELVKRGRNVDLEIADCVRSLKLKRVGFDTLNTSVYLKLVTALKNVNLTIQGKLLWKLREVKDDTELMCIQKAAEITDIGMNTAFEVIRSGMREIEVAAEIEYAMRKVGSDGVAFDTIVASGSHSAFPHGGCTDRKIRRGDLVVLDFGAKYQNYRADLTRTVTVGKPLNKHLKLNQIVRNAHQKAFESICDGVKACDVDAIARGLIENDGYGEYFVHSLGHGVGLDIHEPPALSPENKESLREGNVVTVEPGIYIVGLGGIRIEDTVLVHKKKAEKLTSAPYIFEIQ